MATLDDLAARAGVQRPAQGQQIRAHDSNERFTEAVKLADRSWCQLRIGLSPWSAGGA
jgi:hypothetical protein